MQKIHNSDLTSPTQELRICDNLAYQENSKNNG